MNPLWVRYKVRKTFTDAWKKTPGSGEEYSGSDAEYACKGQKTRSWARHLLRNGEAERRAGFIIYNGEVQIRPGNKDNEYIVSKIAPNDREAPLPLTITGEEGFFRTLSRWQAGKTKVTAVSLLRKKDKEGEPLAVLDIRYGSGWRNKVWLLPEQGYFLRRWEVYNARNGPVDISEVLETMTVNGLLYPKRGRDRHFMAGGKLGFTETFEVTQLETEAGEIPDSLFRFDLPKGASVWDADLKVHVRNSELTQSHLNEVLQRLGTPQSLWKQWWFLGGVAVGVALLGYVGMRLWRRRKGRLTPGKEG